jgi:hypothetical protein
MSLEVFTVLVGHWDHIRKFVNQALETPMADPNLALTIVLTITEFKIEGSEIPKTTLVGLSKLACPRAENTKWPPVYRVQWM